MNIHLISVIFLLQFLAKATSINEFDLNTVPVEEDEVGNNIAQSDPSPVLPIGQGQYEGPQRQMVIGSVETLDQVGSSGYSPSLMAAAQNIQLGKQMVGDGIGGWVTSSNAPLSQPTIGQHLHNFEKSADAFEGHHNILVSQAQQSGKQQVQQPDARITGKRKASELEEPQQSELFAQARSQQGGNVAATAVMAPKARHTFTDLMAEQYPYMTKSKQGDNYAHCNACKSDILVTNGHYAIFQHEHTGKHKKAIAPIGNHLGEAILTIFDSNGKPFEHLTTSELGDNFVHCTACNCDIKMSTMGKPTSIKQHQQTKKHKNAIAQIGHVPTDRGNGSH